jgi:hypothetical protein
MNNENLKRKLLSEIRQQPPYICYHCSFCKEIEMYRYEKIEEEKRISKLYKKESL